MEDREKLLIELEAAERALERAMFRKEARELKQRIDELNQKLKE
jgi:hypothetical protein